MAVIEKGKGGGFEFKRFFFAFVVLFMALGNWAALAFYFNPEWPELFKTLPKQSLLILALVQAAYSVGGFYVVFSLLRRGKLSSLEVLVAGVINVAVLSPLIFKLL